METIDVKKFAEQIKSYGEKQQSNTIPIEKVFEALEKFVGKEDIISAAKMFKEMNFKEIPCGDEYCFEKAGCQHRIYVKKTIPTKENIPLIHILDGANRQANLCTLTLKETEAITQLVREIAVQHD